ncbi:MAG TPA: SemiSWEET transporter [Candidatus Edwardsbacteria bacterium]|nr:SemiSWEET transporter [Candidatus Edwardsbacteria bacterium]
MLVKVIGFSAAVLSTFSFLPQVIKSWRTHRMADINLLFLVMLIAGLVCWTVYGFMLHEWPLILANCVTLGLNLVLLVLKLKSNGKCDVKAE